MEDCRAVRCTSCASWKACSAVVSAFCAVSCGTCPRERRAAHGETTSIASPFETTLTDRHLPVDGLERR